MKVTINESCPPPVRVCKECDTPLMLYGTSVEWALLCMDCYRQKGSQKMNETEDSSDDFDEDAESDHECPPYFVGCTCEHDQDQHSWGHCGVEGCPCEGGWKE